MTSPSTHRATIGISSLASRLLALIAGAVVLAGLVGVGYGLVVDDLTRGAGRIGTVALMAVVAVAIFVGSWAQTTGSSAVESVRVRPRR